MSSAPRFDVSSNVEPDEWLATVNSCAYATFFHTPSWFTAFSKTLPSLKVTVWRFTFPERTVAILPVMVRRSRVVPSHTYVLGPAGCYGGWISPDNLSVEQATAIVNWALRTFPNVVWRINPLDPVSPLLECRAATYDTTEMLNLMELSGEDNLRKNYRHSVRKEIKKAIRAGVHVTRAETWSDWETYYRIYEGAMRRWGDNTSSRYPITLFRNFKEQHSENIILWLVKHEERIIGGNINFYHNRHCVEWHAVFDSSCFGIGARHFMVDHIIADARRRGYELYDFNPSGGHEGTQRFKQAFGTRQIPTSLIAQNQTLLPIKMLKRISRPFRRG